jgi:hypothetical protein
MGSLVKTGNFIGEEFLLKTETLSEGVYILVINGESKKIMIVR